MNKANVLLVAYSGFPEINSTWMHLDNGVALLGGSLLEAGHDVHIRDFQTLETWNQLYPHNEKAEYLKLRNQFDTYLIDKANGKQMDDAILSEARAFDEDRIKANNRVAENLASNIINKLGDVIPDVIGFKLWSQNSFAQQEKIASILKRRYPNAWLLGGGPATELLGGAIFRYTKTFDLLIYGPGEKVIVDIANMKMSGEKKWHELDSVMFLEDGQLQKTTRNDPDLSNQSLPSYNEEHYIDYAKKMHNVHVESDRGCNFKCEFCIHPLKSGRQQKSNTEEFVKNLSELNRQYGFSYFHLAGSDPMYRHMVEISDAVIDAGHDFGFMGFQSLRALDDKGLASMQKANFDRLWVGIESGDPNIVIDLQKGRKLDRLENRAELVRKHGIAITGSVITPCPGESANSVEATQDVLSKVQPDVMLAYPPLLQPGSTWFNRDTPYIKIKDRQAVEDAFVRGGMEWHPGNRILPTPFYDPSIDENVQINDKPYTESYVEHIGNLAKLRAGVANRNSAAQFSERNRHRSHLKRLYFKAQVAVCSSIRDGSFERATDHVARYNKFVLRGAYSATV